MKTNCEIFVRVLLPSRFFLKWSNNILCCTYALTNEKGTGKRIDIEQDIENICIRKT